MDLDMDLDLDTDRVALEEELTVQKVVLESLQDQVYDGVDGDRDDIRRGIQRLKRLLKGTSRNGRANRQTQHQAPTVPVPLGSSSSSSLPLFSSGQTSSQDEPHEDEPHQATPGPASGTRLLRTSDAGMSTPPGASGFGNMSGIELTRKRDLDTAQFGGVSNSSIKARRTIKASPSSTYANTSVSDFHTRLPTEVIDLTGSDGDDDDLNANYVAAQLRDERRREQLRSDEKMARAMAMQLAHPSPQSSAQAVIQAPGANDGHTTVPTSTEGFPAMQLPGAWPAHPQPVPHSHVLGSNHGGFVDPVSTSASWSAPRPQPHAVTSHHHHHHHHHGRAQPQQYHHHMNGPLTLSGSSTNTRMAPPRLTPHHVPISPFGGTGIISASQLAASMQINDAPPLSEIIRRTNSTFSYANGQDSYGNPLPGRVENIIQDGYDPALTRQELEELLRNIEPSTEIPPELRHGSPKGLKCPLYPHQDVALTWMKKMESGSNQGGILADDMGLGKTISTIALMLANPSKDRPKTNLLVGPVALLRQWEEEIRNKVKPSHKLSVFVYHNKKLPIDELLKYDVVLTTYGTVAQDQKRLEAFLEGSNDRYVDFTDPAVIRKCGLFHPTKAFFHRIILDEAQCIKNRDTRASKSCHQLKSKYRWCLTGTPMMNSVFELYPLVRFLRIKPYNDWSHFRRSYSSLLGRSSSERSIAVDRLRAFLRAIMLRRKKDTKVDGKLIVELPNKTEEIVYAQLSEDEQDFYNQLERRSRVQFSKYLREGSVGKNYSSILVLLLRLRQACCHPHLNLDLEDVMPISPAARLELVKQLDAAIVNRIKGIEAFECPICYDAVQSPAFLFPCGHDSCNECLARLSDTAQGSNLREGDESARAKCPVCRTAFDPNKVFSYDDFKQVHMAVPEPTKAATSAASQQADESDSDDYEDESNGDSSSATVSYGSDTEVDEYGNLRDFVVTDGGALTEGRGKQQQPLKDKKFRKPNKSKKKKTKAVVKPEAEQAAAVLDIKPSEMKALRKEAYKNRETYERYMAYLRATWMPAAKVSECMRLLHEFEEAGQKTIIFSQWTLLLDLLEVAMHHEGFNTPQRYDGSMNALRRNDAAQKFQKIPGETVMLVSLRAGNAGLNLTSASRVIIMDPFWNPFIEMQAIDRAYRIGQQREVKVYRILTQNTVEDRIVELQDRKRSMVEAALSESEGNKIGRLGVDELRFLFNTVGDSD